MGELLGVALLLGLLGLLLVVLATRGRRKRGLGPVETIALDNRTLFSERLKLAGRPDRIIRQGEDLIPEEWKSSKRVSEGHRLQLGTYFLLIEEEYGVRPPFGVGRHSATARGSRSRTPSGFARRSWALPSESGSIGGRIREEIAVRQPACEVPGVRAEGELPAGHSRRYFTSTKILVN